MAGHHHTTFTIKKEPDFSPGCGFRYPLENQGEESNFDMDLTKFLGESDIVANPNELEPSEWNSLFTGTELEGLDFLDPTTGAPTSAGMAEHTGFVPGNTGLPSSTFTGPGDNQSGGDNSGWLFEQSQKLERQQQLQQQKLLELEQTLLRTEILKNRLEIVSNLKHASPELQTQLIGALSNRPSPIGGVQSPPPQMSLATPTSVTGRLVNRNGATHVAIPRNVPVSQQPTVVSSPNSSSVCLDMEEFPEGKKKSHNLIEKKYRTSINDRIGVLRDLVSKHFKDDKKMQKSAVLQKTIDYIRYLENTNRKILEENKKMKIILSSKGLNFPEKVNRKNRSPPTEVTVLQSNGSPLSWSEFSDEGHPSSPDVDVFLSDISPTGSPPLSIPPSLHSYPSSSSSSRMAGQIFMCFMLVLCFFIDPFSMTGSQGSDMGTTHGSQRTLNWMGGAEEDGVFTLEWFLTWIFRFLVAGICYGIVWISSLPKHNPDWEGVRFWRLRKQAEQEIKNGDFSSAQIHLVSALTEIGLPLPTSYSTLTISLFWNSLSHLLFQLYIGRIMVSFVSFVLRRKKEPNGTNKKSCPQEVGYADVSKTLHLLHQISLASYDARTMHGLGFYLGLTALNYGEVEQGGFTRDQWAELLFAMGVQCQFSCACIASLLARYYFVCAGNMGGLLSFINTDDGWDFLMSKEWVRDVQVATKFYKGVAVFPKYSVARSYNKALLTEAYRDLLLSHHNLSNSPATPTADIEECKQVLHCVLEMTRQANSYIVEDMKLLTGGLPSLSDTVTTRDCGFKVLMWWASVGLVACEWASGKNGGEEHSPIIEDLSEESTPVPTALHLAFKAQRLHRQSATPPLSVINQLCATASHSLKTCDQNMASEDHLHLLGLFLACDWLLSLRYSLWQENESNKEEEEARVKHVISGYKQDIKVLSRLTSYLPGAFPQLSKYKGYERIISRGNPILADSFLSFGELSFRHRNPLQAQT